MKKIKEFSFCFGCFRKRLPEEKICPDCGYDHTQCHNPKYSLQEGTILNDKFIVGRFLDQNHYSDSERSYIGMDLLQQKKVLIREFFPSYSVTPEKSQAAIELFLQEAKVFSKIKSRSVVSVLDYFYENDTAYIINDFVEHMSSFREVLRQKKKIPWRQAVTLMLPVLMELDKIHKNYQFYPGFEPEIIRIMVDEKTGEEYAVLEKSVAARNYLFYNDLEPHIIDEYFECYIDFNIKPSPSSDVYSVCAVMFETITGRKPPNYYEQSRLLTEKAEPNIISETLREFDIAYSIKYAITRGLELNPNKRFQTIQELCDEFHKGLNHKVSLDILNSYFDKISRFLKILFQRK